jgi:hypothetical protein
MSGTWIMVSLIGVLGSADDNALLEPQVGPYPRRPLVTSTVSNVEPRRTVEGGVVNAHDSGVVQDPASGTFYLYGISFGTNCTDFNNCAAACGHDMKSTGVCCIQQRISVGTVETRGHTAYARFWWRRLL